MRAPCAKTSDIWARFKQSGVLDSDDQDELKNHLAGCALCRAFVYERSFRAHVKAAYGDAVPEPSPGFYTALNMKLDDVERGREAGLFAELIGQLGIKLAPALAALVIVLSGTAAFLSREETAAAGSYTAEDTILFETVPVSADLVIDAVMGDDL
ncbi:MAG: hypothetical protein GY868_01020 [Deltaproteobacteria bacterium]|nr:hypothetical protein [Deltaproteobacteria bacterium]